jgi:uncharacterized Zn finger protein (UPF0148 family)
MSAHKCEVLIFGGYVNNQCSKNAAHEHEGKWFCKTHHPPTIKAKSAARTADLQAKWDAQEEASKAKSAAQAEQKRRADCFPELLAALKELDAATDRQRRYGQPISDAQKKARAAITKATGVQP